MTREWKPGDVAVATVRDVPNVRVVRDGTTWAVAANTDDYFTDRQTATYITDIRPLVVIDPEDAGQVKRLTAAWETVGYGDLGEVAMTVRELHMQAALREFANPTPPKPEEPTGLGAVVEDAEGRKWVRALSKTLPWYGQPDIDDPNYFGHSRWVDIAAVRVLSEGVTT